MTATAPHLAPPRLGAGRLSLGLVVSVALHGGLALGAFTLTRPSMLPDQPRPKSELRIETEAVAEVSAPARDAAGARASEAAPKSEAAAQGAIPASSARPVVPQATPQAAAAPQAQALAAQRPEASRLDPAPAPDLLVASAASAQATTLPAAIPPTASLAATRPAAAALPATLPAGATLAATAAPAAALSARAPRGQQAAPLPPPATTTAPVTPDIPPVQATLAWAGAGAVDPVSLQAIASFMQPADARPDALHDGLGALLSSVPCARLQVEFNPESGALALRGHVPDEAQRAPLLAALQAQIGPGIAVEDSLVLLPRPQCGALSGIADVGLPQSQDQLTNPRLIGAEAQARTFTYGAGQSMVLDLAAPDYDAYLYVDYFDAGGGVTHLTPNDRVPLRLRKARTALKVGAEDQGEPFLQITIGPPYGQEIAVAFAASAPLYDGTRPLSEPAEPYLKDLQARVAEARAKDPGFKGEWVYFMVVTHP